MTVDTTSPALLSVDGVSKQYVSTPVLNNVSLDIHAGTCLALVGENGAGKSTLVKILSGLISPSSGTLRMNGQVVTFGNPRDAQVAGIATIPQELAYVPDMTIAENLLLGRWPSRFGVTSQRGIRSMGARILEQLGLPLRADGRMSALSLAERQLVEIAKALSTHARLIILDEPTAALNNLEAERLLTMLARLKSEGVGLLFVSHRLDECFRIADRIVVLRNGDIASALSPEETTPSRVVNDMLGHEYHRPHLSSRSKEVDEQPIVRARGWSCDHVPQLRGVDFDVHRGQVLSVFGVIGSGAEVISQGLSGHPGPHIDGQLEIKGRVSVPFRRPSQARRASVCYVPAERKTDGLALGRPVVETLTGLIMRRVSKGGVVQHGKERALGTALAQKFGIKLASVRQPVGQLSGGNQQKALLASRLVAEPEVLVLHEPTRGVDVAARSQIHELIVSTARKGAAVVIITSEADEAVALGDRVLVIRQGRVAAELEGEERTQSRVLAAASSSQAHLQEEPGHA